jgi:hypothetical protein
MNKVIKNEELVNLRGGYGGNSFYCLCTITEDGFTFTQS